MYTILKMSPLVMGVLIFICVDFAVAEDSQSTLPAITSSQPENQKCIAQCLRRNQMGSVGFEIIQEQCRKECRFQKILALLNSPNKDDHTKGGKGPCRTEHPPSSTTPLISALERDLKERSGLWAWIIPALGALKDPSAVPVLTRTLTLDTDDWYGRKMSALALGSIGAPSSVPYLLNAAWRADTRDEAIQALVNFRDKRTIDIFLPALDPGEEIQTREAAMEGLHLLRSDGVPAMMEAFTDFSPEHPETAKRL